MNQADGNYHCLVRPMVAMPFNVKIAIAKFIQKVLSAAAAINTITGILTVR